VRPLVCDLPGITLLDTPVKFDGAKTQRPKALEWTRSSFFERALAAVKSVPNYVQYFPSLIDDDVPLVVL
jgi:hypothetical protein